MRFLFYVCFFVFYCFNAMSNSNDLVFSDEEIAVFNKESINPEKTLSENLKQIKEDGGEKVEGTWIEEGIGLAKGLSKKAKEESDLAEELDPILSSGDAIKNVVNQRKKQGLIKGGSNASVFDISGIMLRMSVLQAESVLRKKGFDKMSQDMQIPNFIKWRNEEKCRNSGVIGYERLASCVANMAQKEQAQYIESARYINKKSKEEIEIFMTSNFTGNKIYRITYTTELPGIKGNSNKAKYLRDIKIFEFWRKINQKYGRPDDEEQIVWSMGSDKPFLRATTGFLVLEDPSLQGLDWERMSKEDQKYLNTDMYNF